MGMYSETVQYVQYVTVYSTYCGVTEELVAMIQFAGPPALQEAPRALCLEYSDIFATSVRRLPAKVQSMVLDRSGKHRAIDSHNEAIRQKSKQPFAVIEESRASAPHGQEAHPR